MHRKKQTSSTQDASFDDLFKQFESRQEISKQFERGVQDWLVKIKQNVHALSDVVNSLDAVYGDSDGIGLRSMRAFKKLVSQLETNSVVKYKHQKERISTKFIYRKHLFKKQFIIE